MNYKRILSVWVGVLCVVLTPFWGSYVHAKSDNDVEIREELDQPTRVQAPYIPLKGPYNMSGRGERFGQQPQGPPGSCVLYSNVQVACPVKSASTVLHPFYAKHKGYAHEAALIETPANIDGLFFLVTWVIEGTIEGHYIFAFEKNGNIANGFADGGVLKVAQSTNSDSLVAPSAEFPRILAGRKGIWVGSLKTVRARRYSAVNRYLYDSGKLDRSWANNGELVLAQVFDGFAQLEFNKTFGDKLLVCGDLAPGEKGAKTRRYFLSLYTEDGTPEPGFGKAFQVYSVNDEKKITVEGTVILENDNSDGLISCLEAFELKTGGFLVILDHGYTSGNRINKSHHLIGPNGVLEIRRVSKEIDNDVQTLRAWAYSTISVLDIKSVQQVEFHGPGASRLIVNMKDGRIYLVSLPAFKQDEMKRTTPMVRL